ncbi:MAG: TraV family lipoprotein [Pseudomonadota bacterium]
MKHILLISSLFAMTGVTGCASAVKLENVAGTWSCPRVDGVCADIATLDAELVGAPSMRGIGSASETIAAETDRIAISAASSAMPARTADEIARIVFAPSIDASGHFHGARAIYAVMKPGEWIEGPVEETPEQSTSLVDGPTAPTSLIDTDETASASLPVGIGETTTRVIRRTVSPTTYNTADLDQSHDD